MYFTAIKYLGILAVILAVGLWQRHDGATSERLAWETRLAEENAHNAKLIQDAEEKSRQAERDSQARVNKIAADYDRRLANAKNEFKTVDAGVAGNTFRLLDRNAAAVCADYSGGTETSASTGKRDGSEGCQLSANTSRSLWYLATNADDIAEQLTACQAIVEADRK